MTEYIKITVIISTRNRARSLKKTLESMEKLRFCKEDFEIVIVDNNSKDTTRTLVKTCIKKTSLQIRYLWERRLGLLYPRHAGARAARGEVLVYTDDDVLVSPGWLEAIWKTFQEKDVGLVGGKILPKYQAKKPAWVDSFIRPVSFGGWTLGPLSLLDFGDQIKEIPAEFVWGCNFAVRKTILFECGGFHPDWAPPHLKRYIGDGESGLAWKIKAKGYRVMYNPKAWIYHVIPPERLTIDYFCKRAFLQGIVNSFTNLRYSKGIKSKIHLQVNNAYKKGLVYHREQVLRDPKLLKWVLKDTYLDD